jgi:hypothetical protein
MIADIAMFYGLQNLDHEFRCAYVQFIVLGVRSSLPVISISERTDRMIAKFVSSFLKISPQHDVYKCRIKCYLNWPFLRLLLHGVDDG